jgi:Icc-related predicted phosphoesterase
MKIMAIADLHGRLPDLSIYGSFDCLLIAGDFCADLCSPWDYGVMRARQMEWLETSYARWEQRVPARHILVTPGNHDWVERLPDGLRSRMLIDEEWEVDGVRFWLTPWVSPICDWNYMLERGPRKERFALIPEGLDMLVSHSPAHGVLDVAYNGEACGCPELRQAIYRAQPKHCVFGHIHEGRRHKMPSLDESIGNCLMHNVAMWGRDWQPTMIEL